PTPQPLPPLSPTTTLSPSKPQLLAVNKISFSPITILHRQNKTTSCQRIYCFFVACYKLPLLFICTIVCSIVLQHFGAIISRINRKRQYFKIILLPKSTGYPAELRSHNRTNIGAGGKKEVYYRDMASKRFICNSIMI